LNLSLILLVVFSMILAACGAPAQATEVVVAPPTEAPAATEVAVVTEAPVVEAPAEIDYATLYAEMIGGLPQGYGGIKPADVSAAMAEATPPFLLDVREPSELEKDGYIKGAVNISVREVLKNLDKLPGLDEKIIIYCGSGQRGGILMSVLRVLGYTNVLNMSGGLAAWKTAELLSKLAPCPKLLLPSANPLLLTKNSSKPSMRACPPCRWLPRNQSRQSERDAGERHSSHRHRPAHSEEVASKATSKIPSTSRW